MTIVDRVGGNAADARPLGRSFDAGSCSWLYHITQRTQVMHMDGMWDKISQSVAEKKSRIESLSDAELDQVLQEPSKYSPAEVEFAREKVLKRSSITSTPPSQIIDQTTFVARQPMLVAWIMFFVLNALTAFVIGLIVRSTLISYLIMMVVGYFIFKMVIEASVLPYISQQQIKANLSKDGG